MFPITYESKGLVIFITSCLTSNYLTSLLYAKLLSLEVIHTITAMRNTSHHIYNYDGVYTGRTNRGIPALLPPKGNRRAY
jgi:hypothetical protein